MYRIAMIVALLALAAPPVWARSASGHATMHRVGSYHRHHQSDAAPSASAAPQTAPVKANESDRITPPTQNGRP
jgi:hypothetical protein